MKNELNNKVLVPMVRRPFTAIHEKTTFAETTLIKVTFAKATFRKATFRKATFSRNTDNNGYFITRRVIFKKNISHLKLLILTCYSAKYLLHKDNADRNNDRRCIIPRCYSSYVSHLFKNKFFTYFYNKNFTYFGKKVGVSGALITSVFLYNIFFIKTQLKCAIAKSYQVGLRV